MVVVVLEAGGWRLERGEEAEKEEEGEERREEAVWQAAGCRELAAGRGAAERPGSSSRRSLHLTHPPLPPLPSRRST